MIQPIDDYVAIELQETESTTSGGLIIPDTAKEKKQIGKVIAVGQGKTLNNGELKPLQVKIGDVVAFSKYAGSEIIFDGITYQVVREEDGIFAILS